MVKEETKLVKEASQEAKEESTITFKKSTLWKFSTFLFLGLFILSIFTGGFNNFGGGLTGKTIEDTGDSGGDLVASPGKLPVKITSEDPILGSKTATIKVVEYSDFQCPFCARAATGSVQDLKDSDYFKKGQVALIYKHFPLNSIHPYAQKAAEASECANRQGKFWEYHDLLFANQESLDVINLKSYAAQLKLDTTKFNKCLDNGEATSKVNKDLTEATNVGGRGTPYFVLINKDGETQAISGAVPFNYFDDAIKALQ